MAFRSRAVFILFLTLLCAALVAQTLPAQTPAAAPQATEPEAPTFPIELDGQTLFSIANGIGGYSPSDRAHHIQSQIQHFAESDAATAPLDSLTIRELAAWTEIATSTAVIMAITDTDAAAAGVPRPQLAASIVQSVREATLRYRTDHSWDNILRAILYTAIATLVFVLLMWAWTRLIRWIRQRTDAWLNPPITDGRSRLRIALSYLHSPVMAVLALLQWAVVLILLETFAVKVLHFFPQTRAASLTVSSWLVERLSDLSASAVAYLPNLLLLAVLAAITYYVLRANSLLFREIETGKLQFAGFYPDWARPTAGLVRVLIFMLAAVVMFPYLPGAKTPAFQGISIFLGALLSFGGSSAVANAVAGTILTYMRSFQLGDWVKIGEVTGEITEKSLLVTRVRTPKNEIVTIPNATVMSGSVMNYSAQARTTGVVFHTTVTIGYDAPWRTVHELLISAAFATTDIEASPKPFVLQTALNDFYVSYELNAYTRNPNLMPAIYSDLHQNIQDKFNQAGVEIMSPHYNQLRDGNQTTTPASYLPRDYKAPGFRVEKSEE